MKKHRITLILLLGALLSVSLVHAVKRTINVDRDTTDWDGIPPLVTDPEGDTGLDPEDIKAVYTAHDDDYLYFWMEIYPYVIIGSNMHQFNYVFFLDTVPGQGDPVYAGADYAIQYRAYAEVQQFNNLEDVKLFIYEELLWTQKPCEGLKGNSSTLNIEVGVPWACIGGKQCINALSLAESVIDGTDYCPDMVESNPVTVTYCPGEEEPVGGELIEPLTAATHRTLITVLMATTTLYAIGKANRTRKL
jgi:hypothetical protein